MGEVMETDRACFGENDGIAHGGIAMRPLVSQPAARTTRSTSTFDDDLHVFDTNLLPSA
ncbi:hypothetical protein [Luteimonas sp. BLCC-B24]|uniref:hypothetical protein n=1 Tax=Luteimonas sp. BLCC-B24 TaxID=3025317 RepID=UPI00234D8A5D|nr:hypothetical protein [Luteimonas sp. BLCC-B24]